jgi:hypothetical protein
MNKGEIDSIRIIFMYKKICINFCNIDLNIIITKNHYVHAYNCIIKIIQLICVYVI